MLAPLAPDGDDGVKSFRRLKEKKAVCRAKAQVKEEEEFKVTHWPHAGCLMPHY